MGMSLRLNNLKRSLQSVRTTTGTPAEQFDDIKSLQRRTFDLARLFVLQRDRRIKPGDPERV